jgi:hypothetical protein
MTAPSNVQEALDRMQNAGDYPAGYEWGDFDDDLATLTAYIEADVVRVPREEYEARGAVVEAIAHTPVVMFGGLPFISFGAEEQRARAAALARYDAMKEEK